MIMLLLFLSMGDQPYHDILKQETVILVPSENMEKVWGRLQSAVNELSEMRLRNLTPYLIENNRHPRRISFRITRTDLNDQQCQVKVESSNLLMAKYVARFAQQEGPLPDANKLKEKARAYGVDQKGLAHGLKVISLQMAKDCGCQQISIIKRDTNRMKDKEFLRQMKKGRKKATHVALGKWLFFYKCESECLDW